MIKKKMLKKKSIRYFFFFFSRQHWASIHWPETTEVKGEKSWADSQEGRKEGRDPTMGYRVCCIVHCKQTELSPDNTITNHEDWLTARIPHEHVVLCHGFNSTLKTSTKS